MSHFEQLLNAFQTEWANARHQALPPNCTLQHEGTKYWWIEGADGLDIINWECRNFPGCASLIVTTKVVLREDLRGRGLGRFFREFRHKAYSRAGFAGEIATVRTDNPAQNRLMQTMGAIKMGEFPSDFGGAYALWLTKLPPTNTVQATPPLPMPRLANPQQAIRAEQRYQAFAAPEPGPTWVAPQQTDSRQIYATYNPPGRVGIQARVHEQDLPAVLPGRREKKFSHRNGL